jgi:hypothetical protein
MRRVHEVAPSITKAVKQPLFYHTSCLYQTGPRAHLLSHLPNILAKEKRSRRKREETNGKKIDSSGTPDYVAETIAESAWQRGILFGRQVI